MATITITTNASHDARIAAAIGAYLGLGRSATAAEIKAVLIQDLKRIVQAQEAAAAAATVTEVGAT